MKHYYGITVTEIWENGAGKIFRTHEETELLRFVAEEGRFDIDLILSAILIASRRGGNYGKPGVDTQK